MNPLLAAKRYGLPVAFACMALILARLIPKAAPVYLLLAIAAASLFISVSLPIAPRRWSTHLAVSVAAFLITLGTSVLLGWSSHIRMLIQLLPELPPMMKNTAACFVLSGLALFLTVQRRLRWAAALSAGIVGVLGLLTAIEYVWGVNTGTDQILGPYAFEFKVSNPGRSAPASAVCFVLSSLCLLLAASDTKVRSTWTLGLIGSTVAAVGLATALEFSLGSSEAFGWANFTGMAVHTAVGLCALGLGLIALAWQSEADRRRTPPWLPISVLIGVATGVVGVWQGLIAGGQAPLAPIPAIVLIGGCVMAATFGLTVALAQRAYSREETLRAMRTKLAHAAQLATVAQLSAAIAHEVNQPLAAVVANAGACHRWLSATPPNLERAQLTAERIVRDGKAASEVVSRVRSLFKQSSPTATPLNFNEVIAEVCTLMRAEESARNISIETELEPELPPTLADRVQMQQLMVNLARNGLEAMAPASTTPRVLTIRSCRDGTSRIRVDVCDRGVGLQDAEKVFEPFFTTKGTGMGMGLAICRSIIEAHRGQLWTARNGHRGTIFSFTLPVLRGDPQ